MLGPPNRLVSTGRRSRLPGVPVSGSAPLSILCRLAELRQAGPSPQPQPRPEAPCVLLRRASLQGYSTSAFREKLHAFGRQDDADAVAASEKGARGLALEA